MLAQTARRRLHVTAVAFLGCVAGTLGWVDLARSAEPLRWETDLKKAAAESKRTEKPMLIEITADWCTFCKKMKQSYEQPEVARHVNNCFVPVEVDADENPRLVEAVGVEGLPTTVIVSPELRVLKKITGYHPPSELNKQLETICPASYETPAEPAGRVAQVEPKAEPQAEENPFAAPEAPRPPSTPPVAPAVTQTASTTEETEELVMKPAASTRPRASFAGYCLVTLIDGREYVQGDAEFTSVYRAQTLHFASAEAKQAFDTTPEAYWPMIDGYCAVSYMERGDIQPGDPEWAAVFRGRVWFFVDEASRNRFAERPAAFVPENAR